MKLLSIISTFILTLVINDPGYALYPSPSTQASDYHNKLSEKGRTLFKVSEFREVMPNILYRGGSTRRDQLSADQRETLCEAGIGSAFYLYSKKGLQGTSTSCSGGGFMDYQSKDYASAPALVNKRIYKSIHDGESPVFVHCWYGIHATGFVAATALIQFCGFTHDQAVEYWKVGIAKSIQYPKVIQKIKAFKADPSLQLTPAEKERVCPSNPF
jgi:hypothetical protein